MIKEKENVKERRRIEKGVKRKVKLYKI